MNLEDLMALMGGSSGFDPRRRPQEEGFSGGGVGGVDATLARLLPFLMGITGQNATGFDTRNPVAGGNIAPGSSDGQALNQSNAPPRPPGSMPPPTTTFVGQNPGRGGQDGVRGLLDVARQHQQNSLGSGLIRRGGF